MLDRIDMQLNLQATPLQQLTSIDQIPQETSQQVQRRVERAFQRQLQRQNKCNADLNGAELKTLANISSKAMAKAQFWAQRLQLSARALQRSLRVARTIADLEQSLRVEADHVDVAYNFRQISDRY